MDPKLPNELAVIDIGGNTINLALFLRQYDQAGIIKTYKNGQRLRLMEELDGNGFLSQTATLNVENTIETYSSWCASAGIRPENIICVATSAVREAKNRDALIDAIRARLHLVLRILTSEEETALGVAAVRSELDLHSGLVFDLGVEICS